MDPNLGGQISTFKLFEKNQVSPHFSPSTTIPHPLSAFVPLNNERQESQTQNAPQLHPATFNDSFSPIQREYKHQAKIPRLE